MAKDKNITNKKTLLQKLRYKYRLIILNEDTFEQKASVRLSRMNLYVLGSMLLVVLVTIVTLVIAYTPLKYYMPGVGSVDLRTQLIAIEMTTDSLEYQMAIRNHWLQNVQKVIGGELDSTFFVSDSLPQTEMEEVNLSTLGEAEAEFREEYAEEMENFEEEIPTQVISSEPTTFYYPLKFISPADGLVTSLYNEKQGHFGVDIGGKANEIIKAVESGVVIVSDWNPETGNVIAVQHKNNTISFYKHNATLLKKVGNFVNRGDAIALMGNSGNLSDGPHLHFELWQNGKSMDPLKYINLKTIK
jgi:murein DD-endopeptidase MepM/ murein hydrolase activator NlpD